MFFERNGKRAAKIETRPKTLGRGVKTSAPGVPDKKVWPFQARLARESPFAVGTATLVARVGKSPAIHVGGILPHQQRAEREC